MSIHPATEKAEQTLAAYLSGGRLPHALLLEGTSPGEKEAWANRIARGALCAEELPERRPCGECRDCVKAEKEIHPDILTYRGEGGPRSFHIDTVRLLRRQAQIRPNEGRCKVLLLLEVQNMTVQAQNALLKIMEEPPADVYFVLTCENRAALLETILSRVTVIPLGFGEEAAQDGEAARVLLDACIGSELEALGALSKYERDRQGLLGFLKAMRIWLAEALLRPGEDEDIRRLHARAGRLRLLEIVAIIEDTEAAVAGNTGGLLAATSLCARIRAVMEEN